MLKKEKIHADSLCSISSVGDNIVPKSTASQCLNPTVNVTRSILNIEESADYRQPIDQASQD